MSKNSYSNKKEDSMSNKKNNSYNKNGFRKISNIPNEKDFTYDRKEQISFSPRNEKQKMAYNSAKRKPMTCILGSVGSGKNFVAAYAASELLRTNKVDFIILLRPSAVPEDEYLGFLSGDLQEKNAPYMTPMMQPLKDIFGKERVEQMVSEGIIQPFSIAYIRGLNYKRCALIVDEVQNLRAKNLHMILTRVDDNSHVMLLGDEHQIDLEDKENSSIYALEKFRNNPNIGFYKFNDDEIVRGNFCKMVHEILTDKPSIQKEDDEEEGDYTVYNYNGKYL